ncbi:hypothetical protein SeMB42_g06937 [Synchytrium endobioticum]|uniref:C3H1-type domain-containing protein n=1 Tax=Synchytrium endobioticum TaxID=286115 RepID=A0A507CGY6_9FUNG|nr:hypothetical protein SeMB42_g06937 [Synchytrium endobioticum]TPX40734.1 hypothetical protein SeLEV6574_g06439 [Synchytrium endobioticum]
MSHPYYQDPLSYIPSPPSSLSPFCQAASPVHPPSRPLNHQLLLNPPYEAPAHAAHAVHAAPAVYPAQYHLHDPFPSPSSRAALPQLAVITSQSTAVSNQLQPLLPRRATLYKTELCRSWEETGGQCKYADKCQFAHGIDELRPVDRHPRYKTEMCRTFWEKGSCPYGKRCCFIHTERDADLKLPSLDRRYLLLRDPHPHPASPQIPSPVSTSTPTSPPGVELVTPTMGRCNSASKVRPSVAVNETASVMRARSTGHEALTSVDLQALKRVSTDPLIPPSRRQSTLSLRSFPDSDYAVPLQLVGSNTSTAKLGRHLSDSTKNGSSFITRNNVASPTSNFFHDQSTAIVRSSPPHNTSIGSAELESDQARPATTMQKKHPRTRNSTCGRAQGRPQPTKPRHISMSQMLRHNTPLPSFGVV